MPAFTFIVPYYRNCAMLARQLEEWEKYPAKGVSFIVVDDGSPEPARDILAAASDALRPRLKLFRITVDIPWNREGARNLAAQKATTDWIVQIDVDHVLPAECVPHLIEYQASPDFWHRFTRWRNGKADETRQKDTMLARDCDFGEIKPHIDSYLITRDAYWSVNGYDEDFAGHLGGGTDFLRRVERKYGAPLILPRDICLHVYTRDKIADASDWSLSRDRAQGKDIGRGKDVGRMPKNPIRFPWVREL